MRTRREVSNNMGQSEIRDNIGQDDSGKWGRNMHGEYE
jgi:hypothetical protein